MHHVSSGSPHARSFACAELHRKEGELWDAFSKEARSNKTLAPYWELLAMYDGQADEDVASTGMQRRGDAGIVENSSAAEAVGLMAKETPAAASA